MKSPKSFDAVPVACSRGKTFDAELRVNGVHYVVGTGYGSREIAMQYANASQKDLYQAFRTVIASRVALHQWKKAKS